MDTKRDAVNFVAIGYNDACTDFKVSFSRYNFDNALKAIRNVGDYNGFNGAKVAKVVEKFLPILDKIEFGREGSPVLYLYIDRGGEVLDFHMAAEGIINTFTSMKSANPDEVGIDEYDLAKIRFWWD
jgi:hypothetical protein